MKITTKLLRDHNACGDQVDLFEQLYPNGLDPTPEAFFEAAAGGLDVMWAWRLLPSEGPGSQRAYALWNAKEIAVRPADEHPDITRLLEVVRRRVADPGSVSYKELRGAREGQQKVIVAADLAVYSAAHRAAHSAAYWAACRAACRAAHWAQITMLADMIADLDDDGVWRP
jgi:hypothetical protein